MDTGWIVMGLKMNWWMVAAFIVAVVLIIYFVVRPRGPHRHVDSQAGDEGED